MAKDWSKLKLSVPDFSDSGVLLKTLGTIIVDEIVQMIDREEQPDGSPQKQNSPEYAARKKLVKGYTTPLKGIRPESPYLARRSTLLRTQLDPRTLLIHANARRAAVTAKLAERGYWFMGITRRAEERIRDRLHKYLKQKIRRMGDSG